MIAVDQFVVYAGHGVGRVVGKTKRAVGGVKLEVVAIEFASGLSVSIPLERARSQVRPLATKTQLRAVGEILRQPSIDEKPRWLTRRQEIQARLANGSVLDLAEVIHDTAPRETEHGKRVKFSGNTGEREVFVRARELLADEIAHIRGLESEQAQTWIDAQLASG